MLDADTLLLVQVSFTLLTTLLLTVAALLAGRQPEQRAWALGNVVASVGLCLGAMEGAPDIVHAVLGYGLVGLGLGLVLQGLMRYAGQTLATRWLIAIGALSLLLPALFLYQWPSLHGRLIATGILFGLLNLAGAVVLLHGVRDSTRPVMWVSAIGFALLGAVLLLRAGFLAWRLASPEAAYDASLTASLILFAIPLAQVTIAFGLIMLMARRYAEALRQLSLTDTLTGVCNRAGLERRGARLLRRALQAGRPVALLMLDADHFKRINDSHGHPAGDAVLRQLAEELSDTLRPSDLLARYGGEEFVVLLDDSGLAGATLVAERLRLQVAATPANHLALSIAYTVSIGVASSEQHGHDLALLSSQADQALYQAKQQGRDRVVEAL